MENKLTDKEKAYIKVLNFIATFDGLITEKGGIEYLLLAGIKKFIPKKRQHLLTITQNAYPTKIKY